MYLCIDNNMTDNLEESKEEKIKRLEKENMELNEKMDELIEELNIIEEEKMALKEMVENLKTQLEDHVNMFKKIYNIIGEKFWF